MNIQAFIQAYQGQHVPNNAGGFVGECVSLAARWAQEQLDIPNGDSVLYCQTTGGARDLWEHPTDLELQYFEKINPSSPLVGDLIVWGTNRGSYGHIAIYVGGGQVFQQLGTPIFQVANQTSVGPVPPLGYLRKKGEKMAAQDTLIDRELAIKLIVGYLHRPPNQPVEEGAINSILNQPIWRGTDILTGSTEYQNYGNGNFKPYSPPQLYAKG